LKRERRNEEEVRETRKREEKLDREEETGVKQREACI